VFGGLIRISKGSAQQTRRQRANLAGKGRGETAASALFGQGGKDLVESSCKTEVEHAGSASPGQNRQLIQTFDGVLSVQVQQATGVATTHRVPLRQGHHLGMTRPHRRNTA